MENKEATISLYRAAIDGDSGMLLNLLANHPNLLDQFVGAGPYKETPLHVAVQLGHTQFVKEMIGRKPELSSKLDSLRSSPLHLAAAAKLQDTNKINLVKLLLQVNPEMCSVHDKFGNNPIHVAAINGGGEDVLKEMIQARPLAVKDRAKHGNTVLHLCVKHGKLETLKQLLHLLGDDHHFLNSTNDDGDTILHLAAANKQTDEIFEYLINNTAVEVSTENLKGWTALNILARSEELDTEDASSLVTIPKLEGGAGHDHRQTEEAAAAANSDDDKSKLSLIKDMKKIIMLVATLIAGIAFQAMINPPGGLFQVSTTDFAVVAAALANNVNPDPSSPSPAPAPALPRPLPVPGTPVMAVYNETLYKQYIHYSTVSFLTAIAIIYFVTALADHPFGQRYLFVFLIYFLGGASISSLSNAFSVILDYYYSSSSSIYRSYIALANGLWVVLVVVFVLWRFKNCVKKAWTCICSSSHNNNNRVTV